MDYVQLGTAGVKVSRLALGLGLRGQADETVAQRLVESAIDGGITFLDCANVYGPMDDRANTGRSEVVLGKAIKGKRDQVVITSKVVSAVGPGANDRGASRYHILREIDTTLRRLQTDHVDIYLTHVYDPATPLEETIRALDDVVRSGKARYVGCCNYQAWQVCRGLWLADKHAAHPFACVQNPYSLLDRGLETEMFGLVRDRGLGIMAYSPLGVGLLSGTYKPGQAPPPDSLWGTRRSGAFADTMRGRVATVVQTLHDVAAKLGKSPAQVAIAWVLAHPEVTCAISGAETPEQLADVLGSVGWALPDEARRRLDDVSSSMSKQLDEW